MHGLRLGIEPATLDLLTNALPTELQKPLLWACVQVLFFKNLNEYYYSVLVNKFTSLFQTDLKTINYA